MNETLTIPEIKRVESGDLPRHETISRTGAFSGARSKILAILAIPLICCALSFPIVDSNFFRGYADPQWVRSSSQIYSSRNADCEIVIFGDSTAITGIDPKIVEAATHMHTCNLAQTKGVLAVLGTSALDVYLRNNARPRILLIQFAGADFYSPGSWRDTTAYMEGVVPMLRFYPRRQFLKAIVRHPEIYMGMMHYAYITGLINLLRNRFHRTVLPHSEQTPIDVHFVRAVPAFKNCDRVEDLDPIFHAPDARFIRALRQHYSGMADHLILDAAPLSECDKRIGFLDRTLSGIDNKEEPYPVTLFNEGYEHYTAAGARRLSNEIAAQIESLVGREQRHSSSESASRESNAVRSRGQ